MSTLAEDTAVSAPISRQAAADEIAAVWTSILRRDKIEHAQDFFDLGGNSMLLLAMLEVVQDKFNKQINTDDLADGVTVERLASLVA